MAIIPADEKVFMVDKRTNTVYGGSQALQDMQQWYTMQDVSDSVQPYKVFTALLTQNGNDTSTQYISIGTNYGNTLTIGVTYIIDENGNGTDFTNVGAPDNNVGTSFIATGEVPANQNDNESTRVAFQAATPVVNILENTIGNVWFEYRDEGQYALRSDPGAFLPEKTFIPNGTTSDPTIFNRLIRTDGGGLNLTSGYYFVLEDINRIDVFTIVDAGAPHDSVLSATPIEIRVYN